MFWTLQANTILILFWTELGQAENFLIAPCSYSETTELAVYMRFYCQHNDTITIHDLTRNINNSLIN